VRFAVQQIATLGGRDALLLGETPIPLVTLADTLGLAAHTEENLDKKLLAVILTAGEQTVAFVVDTVLGEQEVTVKNLGGRIRRVRNVSGATLLPSGHVALVLNVANLIRAGLGTKPAPVFRPQKETAETVAKRRILVVDDSVTTRTLIKSILETAGYQISAARDGQHALEILEQEAFDLVVSDVDMPRIDGFALTKIIRDGDRCPALPVVLVTARGSEADKVRGIEVRADAYIVKSGFEQTNLLATISQLL
jgi:two-component system chemotaxis sensor kinase CheA